MLQEGRAQAPSGPEFYGPLSEIIERQTADFKENSYSAQCRVRRTSHSRVLRALARIPYNAPMSTDFSNVYDDQARSEAYAKLEFPGTYYLAYRDLPAIIGAHVQGRNAVDFGCGTGRSTRFLRKLGFDVLGLDISEPMLERARERDPQGEYRLVMDGDLGGLAANSYDLVFSAFTFDNIPTLEKKVSFLRSLKKLLRRGGRMLNLVSSPDIYVNEWASFSTKDFPENQTARCGDKVRIVMLDVEDRRPVEDVLWTDGGYRAVYERTGLAAVKTYKPLATPTEPYSWVSETIMAPWVIYVLEEQMQESAC